MVEDRKEYFHRMNRDSDNDEEPADKTYKVLYNGYLNT